MRCSAGRAHVTLHSTSALLIMPGTQIHNLGLKSFNQYPHILATRKPVGSHYIYLHTIHALIVENYRKHTHARVCSALTHSVLQCAGVIPGFTEDWYMGPLIVSEMTYTVSSGTLNSTIPYHTIPYLSGLCLQG